jgi:hypothetical protein
VRTTIDAASATRATCANDAGGSAASTVSERQGAAQADSSNVMVPNSTAIWILRMRPLTSVLGKRDASDRTNGFEDLGRHGDG